MAEAINIDRPFSKPGPDAHRGKFRARILISGVCVSLLYEILFGSLAIIRPSSKNGVGCLARYRLHHLSNLTHQILKFQI